MNTPRDEFDDMEDGFRFPGAEPDPPPADLPEDVLNFTFDEDYLEPHGGGEQERERRLDAVISAFREEQSQAAPPAEPEPEPEPDPVDAVFNALLRKEAQSREEPEPQPVSSVEEELASAMRAQREPPAQREPSGAKPVPAVSAAPSRTPQRKKRRREDTVLTAPVTVGRKLRGDQMLVYDSELDEVDYTDDEDLPEVRDYLPIRFARYGRIGIGGGILYALFVISASVILACLLWLFASDVLALNKEPGSAIVTIEEYVPTGDQPATVMVGDTEQRIKVDIDQVATELKNKGMIEYTWLFKLFSQFSHAEAKIDPGTYDVSTELDYRALVTSLQFGSGKQEVTRITFPEGYTVAQTFALLEENQICHVDELYEAAANYEFRYDFIEELSLGDENRLEGYLFPDTYDFYQNESASVSLSRFLSNLNNKLTDEVRQAAENRGLTVRELLTIASLIEKEAGSDDERATIASVIYNRLNAGMKLQLDSTINYINNTSTFNITNADMEIDDPYNTYMYEGLPPGPICSPGMASIMAAIEPESTDYWYWYAVDGETFFFTNHEDFDAFADAHPY